LPQHDSKNRGFTKLANSVFAEINEKLGTTPARFLRYGIGGE
jgi:hypothetical protein